MYIIAFSVLPCRAREGIGKDGGREKGRTGGGDEESAEQGSIKSIQLRHELEGSLSMSKPMKMTIHQERVLWQR